MRSSVDAESVRRVLDRLLEADNAPEESTATATSLAVIDAFLVPKYRYDAVKKQFIE